MDKAKRQAFKLNKILSNKLEWKIPSSACALRTLAISMSQGGDLN